MAEVITTPKKSGVPGETQLPKLVKDYYDKGVFAFNKANYDYAIELFTQALALKHDFVDARRQLRLAEKKRIERHPPSLIKKSLIQLTGAIPLVIAMALDMLGKRMKAIDNYEKILKTDPGNIIVLHQIANLFIKEGMTESAIAAYEDIIEVDTKDIGTFKELARLYSEKGDYNRARFCYNSVLQIQPGDSDAEDGLKNIDALGAIRKGRWDDQTTTYRTKIKDQDASLKLEKEGKKARTESDIELLIKDNEGKLKTNPNDPVTLRTLGDLYVRLGELDKATERYKRAIELDPTNYSIQIKLSDIQFKRLDAGISEKEESLRKSQDDITLKKELEGLKENRANLELEEAKRRVAQYPSETSYKFQYGILLEKRGKRDEAIGMFQLAVNDPVYRNKSLNMMGLCFQQKKMFDLAVTQFQKALEKNTDLNEDTKEIIYNLGTTYEEMGNHEKAHAEFKKIYEVDITYRDVSQKMEKAYKSP